MATNEALILSKQKFVNRNVILRIKHEFLLRLKHLTIIPSKWHNFLDFLFSLIFNVGRLKLCVIDIKTGMLK